METHEECTLRDAYRQSVYGTATSQLGTCVVYFLDAADSNTYSRRGKKITELYANIGTLLMTSIALFDAVPGTW